MDTNPQIQAIMHTKWSQADGLETGPIQAHLEGCWWAGGQVGRCAGGLASGAPSPQAASSWAPCGASSSLPFSLIATLRFPSGWDRACLALLHTATEQHVPSPAAFKSLPESHLWAQDVFPNSRVAEDSQLTTSRTGILRYQISALTKGNSNKREAGRYFRQNTWCSN